VAPYLCTQPCYFGGPFALNLASDDKHVLKVDAKQLAKRQKKRAVGPLKYWTPEVHQAAFALPAYLQHVVDQAIRRGRGKEARSDLEAQPAHPSAASVGNHREAPDARDVEQA
jgi:hypothetical protein